MYEIKNHPLVKNDLKELDNSLAIMVLKKIKQLKKNPFIGKKLSNKNNLYLSGYMKTYVANKKIRIVYKIVENKLLIFIVSINKRENLKAYREAYKRLGE